jgi:acid phosphatase (class A)
MRAILAAVAGLLLLGAAPAEDDPSLAGPIPTTLTGYLAGGEIDGLAVLGPPPQADSPRGRSDRAYYEATRALAGSPRWAQAVRDNDLWGGGALTRYACVLGLRLDEASTPRTYRLLERVELDVRTVSGPVKSRYDRVRPLIGDDKPVCVKREPWMNTNGSYPSGHAMTGWAWGMILAQLVPARAGGLIAAGREVGDSRPICGVHYVTDVEAGRTLGSAMVARLNADPAFRADLAAARTELAQAKAPAQGCGP